MQNDSISFLTGFAPWSYTRKILGALAHKYRFVFEGTGAYQNPIKSMFMDKQEYKGES
jgi:hypothetical protein